MMGIPWSWALRQCSSSTWTARSSDAALAGRQAAQGRARPACGGPVSGSKDLQLCPRPWRAGEHQRDLPGIVPVELLREANLDGDAIEAALDRDAQDVLRVSPQAGWGNSPWDRARL